MEIIESFKGDEAMQILSNGVSIELTRPLPVDQLRGWAEYLQSIGSPYLIARRSYYPKGMAVIIKERKDYKCRRCGGYIRLKTAKSKRRCHNYPECELRQLDNFKPL